MQKKKEEVPSSIISLYKIYENPCSSLKKHIFKGNTFEIDDRYEIIDISLLYF